MLRNTRQYRTSQYLKWAGLVGSFVVTPPRSETLFIGLYVVRSLGKCEAGDRDPISGIDVSAAMSHVEASSF